MTGAGAKLLAIPMEQTQRIDIYSGVARKSGMLWASLHEPDPDIWPTVRTAVIVAHPSSNFLGHYLLPHLAGLGVAAVGFNTRYIANDSALIMENCVLDLGSAVRLLRDQGYERIVLLGNSGGGGLVALYQSQAESPTITHTPAGDPADLVNANLIPADAVIEFMAHPGRAITYTNWLDPAVAAEDEPFTREPSLDMFDPRNGPPYSEAFLSAYREGQRQRNARITAWVRAQLASLAASATPGVDDLPFVVHGTCADPHFLDLTIDADDRPAGTLWGPPWSANFLPASLGHHTSLRSWLSQWSLTDSNCDGPRHLHKVSVPTLVMYGSADTACFRSDALSLYDAISHADKELVELKGAGHYFADQPDILEDAVRKLGNWLNRHDLV